jgi:deoxycytidylate deaminase
MISISPQGQLSFDILILQKYLVIARRIDYNFIMKEIILRKCVHLMIDDWGNDKSRNFFHYAFAVRKNRIIEMGKNDPIMMSAKAYKLAQKFNINHWKKYPFLHAEADLLLKLDEKFYNKKTTILSLKINRHGQFRFAKPCYKCEIALLKSNLTNIMWSMTDENNLQIPLLEGTRQTSNSQQIIVSP